jgi:small-conductance mechanosensitive channel
MDIITQHIVLTVLTVLIAVAIGLILRRLLVGRLKKTVLDNWLIQTLGVIIVFVPLILSVPVIFVILDNNLFGSLWAKIQAQIHVQDITAISWNLVETVLIIALGIGIARTLVTLAVRGMGENRVDINIRTLVRRIFYIIILSFIVFWVLAIWQIPITIPVTAIGILTLALTVAVQDILKDLVAGFYILMERPFHIGDQISIGDVIIRTGRVEDVQIRSTKLRLVSGEEVAIPNAIVFGSVVINNTFYGERRATIIVKLPEEDFAREETPKKILKALKEVDPILAKPEPTISVSGLSEKHIALAVRFWIARGQHSVITETLYALRAALPDADLTVMEAAGDI